MQEGLVFPPAPHFLLLPFHFLLLKGEQLSWQIVVAWNSVVNLFSVNIYNRKNLNSRPNKKYLIGFMKRGKGDLPKLDFLPLLIG